MAKGRRCSCCNAVPIASCLGMHSIQAPEPRIAHTQAGAGAHGVA